MYLASIYSPSNIPERGSAVRWFKKNWWIAAIIVTLHFVVIYLFILKLKMQHAEVLDDLVIDLSLTPIISNKPIEQRPQEYLEKQAMSDAPKPARGFIAAPPSPVQSTEVAQPIESTAIVKFNEAIKPIKVDKAEPREEKKIPVTPVEKVEEKKPQVTLQPPDKPQTPPKAQALTDEAAPNTLPAIVDKKNKDKDAPELAPPAASSGSSAESAKASIASAAATAPASATAGRQASSTSAPPAAEMQAQISSSKSSALGSPNGNLGTADADYKSEGLKNAQPNYPLYARKMNQEGVVMISVEILTDGSASDVRIAASSGIKLLDQAALEAVKQWNFKPAKKDGILYVQRLRIPIVFSLANK